MLRLAFLLLVVLGALAVVLGLAVGVGVWQAARLQRPADDAPATTAPATVPVSTDPAATAPAGTHAADRSDGSAGPTEKPAADATPPGDEKPVGDAKPEAERRLAARRAGADDVAAAADWPPPDPAAGGRRKRADDAILAADPRLAADPPRLLPIDPTAKPVVLDAGSAEVRGRGGLRVAGDADRRVLVDWRAESDAAVWTVDVPTTGIYVVEADAACDANAGGGAYWVQFVPRDLPGPRPKVTAIVATTGGWDDYRTAPVGQTYLPAGKTEVTLRPVAFKAGHRLANVRAIRLRLVTDERQAGGRRP